MFVKPSDAGHHVVAFFYHPRWSLQLNHWYGRGNLFCLVLSLPNISSQIMSWNPWIHWPHWPHGHSSGLHGIHGYPWNRSNPWNMAETSLPIWLTVVYKVASECWTSTRLFGVLAYLFFEGFLSQAWVSKWVALMDQFGRTGSAPSPKMTLTNYCVLGVSDNP